MTNNTSNRKRFIAAAAFVVLAATWVSRVAGAGGAHADHAPRHGGVLMMKGDVHYEVVVDFRGGFAIYFSDAHRRPLAAESVSAAVMTLMRDDEEGENVMLRSGTGGSWVGAGPSIEGSEITVRVSFMMRGEPRPYSIDITVERAPDRSVSY
jgi:hypothetical protein